MKNSLALTLTLLIFSSISHWLKAQNSNFINFNIDNGFPSNLIYDINADSHGYLWICTDKGLIRYNGYDFKQFTETDGLPTDDVWQVMEDKRGRIWLGAISEEFGYLFNGKYYKSPLKGYEQTIYPINLRPRDSGIVFSMTNPTRSLYSTMFIEKNDTYTRYNITEASFGRPEHNYVSNNLQTYFNMSSEDKYRISVLVDDTGGVYTIYDKALYLISFLKKDIKQKKIIELTGEDTVSDNLTHNIRFKLGKNIMTYRQNAEPELHIFNTENGNKTTLNLASYCNNESIVYISINYQRHYFYIITQHHILKFAFSDPAKFLSCAPTHDLININDNNEDKIRTIYEDSLWATCVGTNTNGIFFNKHEEDHIKPISLNELNGYGLIGEMKDSLSFWWNGSASTLAAVNKNLKIKYYKLPAQQSVTGICWYSSDTFIISGHDCYYFRLGSGTLVKAEPKKFGVGTYQLIIDNKNSSFTITNIGFYHVVHEKDSTIRYYLDRDRFEGLMYDSLRKNFWAYNKDLAYIYQGDNKGILHRDIPTAFGIKKIDKVAFDNKYGNIFIKGASSIILYDPERKTSRELFKNVNVKESSAYVYHNTLIVAGKPGIMFCRILGKGRISSPIVYNNFKSVKYNHIYYCEAVNNQLLLKTDKGFYTVSIPADNVMGNDTATNTRQPFLFIINHNDTISNIAQGDTVRLNPKKSLVQFDVINPAGSGKLKFMYKFATDTTWHQLNANELTIPSFTPDNYYKLSLIASDDIWRSNPIDIYIYIQPMWWQTKGWQKVIWTSCILLALLVLSSAILITRRLVINANKKRNLRMELELKAIYSQINPHFIFNSLNSALLMVRKNKMDETYAHISKFSRLLRSYIKSSRNKLISIEEEVANLTDYIELQQTRFKNKFQYEIRVNGIPDKKQVKIPSLLLQPFIENAINHGLLLKEDAGKLTITMDMSKEKNALTCTIEDNGVGRKHSKTINENKEDRRESYGDLLVKDLVDIFNKYEHMNIDIAYTDKELPETGTLVTITIRNPHYDQ